MTNINNQQWKTAAKKILNHKELAEEVKIKILDLIEKECKTVCKHDSDSMLYKSSPKDLESFSFERLESDLKRIAPFLLSILSTVSEGSVPVTCAAAATALRGREPRLSSFSYFLNSILQHGGAKKAVFQRMSKMALTTTHNSAIKKQQELANLCGKDVQGLKLLIEEHLKISGEEDLETEVHNDPEPEATNRNMVEEQLEDLYRSMEDLNVLGGFPVFTSVIDLRLE